MKTMQALGSVLVMLLLLFSSGCSSSPSGSGQYDAASFAEAEMASTSTQVQRMLIKRASLTVEARDLDAAQKRVEQMVSDLSGHIDNSNRYSETRIHLDVRVPSGKLESFVESVAQIGKVTSRSLNVEDVTEQLVDIEAQLVNLKALRDRYRVILDKATDVKSMLEVEKELARVQTEIDMIEGRQRSLRSQVALSSVSITLEQARVRGPLGLLGDGVAWCVEKLFYIK